MMEKKISVDLGKLSISLTVADLAASRSFYEKLGFHVIDGKEEDAWLILRHGSSVIGLFHNMFDRNGLSFATPDARQVESTLKHAGVEIQSGTRGEEGPTSCMVVDPDGNWLLFDQYQ